MPYITPDGNYYNAGDNVAIGSIEVADRPEGYVLTDNWTDDPMNVLVCWRAKNAGEIDAEKSIKADITKISPFLKAYILCINDGSIIPGGNLTPKQLKAAIKAKL